MTLFPSDTARDVWRGHWCERCFQTDEADLRLYGKGAGCPIIARALDRDRKPVQWKRNARAQTMAAAYGCDSFLAKPAVNRRGKTECVTESLFDVEPTEDRALVPVEGWPEAADFKPATKAKGDHA